ncbi:MAG: hypothetical protein LBN95_08020 [Prevotellaceae bacterium]|jgi:hypothetical protein|nr:hypothetical protein [Prevotellaceae bacterium]
MRNSSLSRATKKTTGIGRTEIMSIFGRLPLLTVFVRFMQNGAVATNTFQITLNEFGTIYKVDVSPSVIAGLADCAESDLIDYQLYKQSSMIIDYVVDKANYPHLKTFMFENSFGGHETFHCLGEQEEERKWARETGFVFENKILISRELENRKTINTGYIKREMIGVLEDLINSKKVAVLENNRLIDVVILEESFKVTNRREDLIAVEFTYQTANQNQMRFNYNPQSMFQVFSDEFNETFG